MAMLEKGGSVSNVRLIEAHRDQQLEAQSNALLRQTGGGAGAQWEVWVITFDYDENGVRNRQEAVLQYVRFQALNDGTFISAPWAIYAMRIVSAPVNKFAQMKPQLYQVAAAVRAVPRWWAASRDLLASLQRQRFKDHQATMAAIRRRGKTYSSITDSQYASWKRDQAAKDKAQSDYLDVINERTDYQDIDGNIVNAPIHYNHVYSNGEGGYILTNDPFDKPNDNWKELDRAP
jgi:hypothetical protein